MAARDGLRGWAAHPAFASVRHALLALPEGAFPSLAELNAALAPRAGVTFERQAVKPRRARRPTPLQDRYHARITHEGRVPTRERNLHDLANALVWASFPLSKRALHGRQQRCLERAGQDALGRLPSRDREQDALSLLDEGGVLLVGPDRRLLASAVGAGPLEVAAKLAEGRAQAWVFGHALLEHLILGRADPIRASITLLEGEAAAPVDPLLRDLLADQAAFLLPHPWPALPLSDLFADR